ncbi:MAG: ABC transporter permease subunit [Olsenella sp.]|jgi:glutamate transport system permease protein|nr:ABC transporter permease subunit [Atopobium sp.]
MSFAELWSAYGSDYITALLTTWQLTAISFVFVMLLSVIITIMRVCPIKPLRVVGDLYVQIFRNIPGISLLIICVYALPYLKVLLSYRDCVIIATILLGSAFGSENFMSGINTIGVGQIEAARSIGLTFTQILRRIVIPQALRSSVLPMTNLLIAVMLTTALGSQVPLDPNELTGIVSTINTQVAGGIATFFISALGYALTALAIGFIGNAIDKKARILR